MKIYSEKKSDHKKRINILGITIYKKVNKNNFVKRKYLAGILKTKRNRQYYKVYLFGIQIYKKVYNFNLFNGFENLHNQISLLEDDIINKMSYINQRLITASVWNEKAFSKWKGYYRGKEIVLIGAGPTVNYFEPINDAIYVGCNRAFLLNNVNFDFLFSIDKVGINKYYDEFFAYKKDSCIKFIGDQNLGKDFQIPETKIPFENVYRYITYAGMESISRFNMDISSTPLHNAASVSLQALQFILYTQPKRVYIVGIDCTAGSKKYFKSDGKEFDNSLRNEDAHKLDEININLYKEIKAFAETYYPDTEIISINPVGLKGIFKDVYTDSYKKHNEGQ